MPRRQPVQQRQDRVKLDREPAVRRRDKDALARDAPSLAQETRLLSPAADMLDDVARMDIVERGVTKRQIAAVGADKA